jgi:hypothetical protein
VRAVVLRDDDGSVTVTGDANGGAITISAQPSYRGAAPIVSSKVTGGVLTVSASCPAQDLRSPFRCDVAVRVSMPEQLRVQAGTNVGSVTVTGMTGSVLAQDNLGPIQLWHLSGRVSAIDDLGAVGGHDLDSRLVTASCHVGRIDLGFAAVPDRVDVTDQDGSLGISVPASAAYRVSASAQLGTVAVTVPQSASSGHVIIATSQLGSVSVTG